VQELGQPPWKSSKRHGPFVGDVANVALRNKLALAPHQLPEPPLPSSTGSTFRLAIRLAAVIVVITFSVVGYRLGSAPPASAPQFALRSSQFDQPPLASERSVPMELLQSPEPASAAKNANTRRSGERTSHDAVSSLAVSRQLTVGAVPTQQVDEIAKLTVSAADAGAEAAVVISGLPSGSTVSTGTQIGPNMWRVSVEELAGAGITPPRGFVGAIDLVLELRLADNTLADRKSLRVEWSPLYQEFFEWRQKVLRGPKRPPA
jgi:hypothetical protein